MSRKFPCIWQLPQLDRGKPETMDGGEEEVGQGCVAVLDDAVHDRDAAMGTDRVGNADPAREQQIEPVPDDAASDAPGEECSADRHAAEPDEAEAGAGTPDDVASEALSEDPSGEAADPAAQSGAEPAATVAPVATVRRRRRWRRGLVLAAMGLLAVLAVSAFATGGPSATSPDQHFVDTARSQGHVIAAGRQETLLVS